MSINTNSTVSVSTVSTKSTNNKGVNEMTNNTVKVIGTASFVSILERGEEVSITVYENNTFKTSLYKNTYQCREYVIVHKYNDNDEVESSNVMKTSKVLQMLLKMTPNFKTKASLVKVLDLFEAKVIIDRSSQPGYYGNPSITTDIFGKTCEDIAQYQAIKDSRISTIGIKAANKFDVQDFAGVRTAGKFIFCKSDLLDTDYATAVAYFNPLNIPVLADKQNVSYLTYGNAVNATFTAMVNGEFKTVMPVADTTKTLKRLASNSASYAVDSEAIHTNLKVRGLDEKLISYVGAPKMAVIAFDKQFNNGSGVALSNMGRIKHVVPKTLTNEIAIDELGKDRFIKLAGGSANDKLDSLVKEIKGYLATKSGTILTPGEELVWEVEGEEDIVLATNNNPFNVIIEQIHPEVSKGLPTYRDQIRSVVVKVATVANEARYNLKGRNGLMKFMTHCKDVVLTSKGEVVEDWDLILSPETNKGALCTLAAFASQFINIDTQKAINLIFDAKTSKLELDVPTESLSSVFKQYLGYEASTVEEAYSKYIEENTTVFTVKEEVAQGTVDEYKDFENDSVKFVYENDKWFLIETFTGILDYVFPLWEVSTPAECAGTNRLGVVEQAVASLYDDKIKESLQAKGAKSVLGLKHFEVNADKTLVHIDRVFDITHSRTELLEFLAKGDNEVSPKAALGVLTNVGSNGCHAIRIKHGGSVYDVPLTLILRSPDWNTKGSPKNGFTPIYDEKHEGEVSYSITGSLVRFLKAIKTCGEEALGQHLTNWKYHYNGFIQSMLDSNAVKNYLSVGKQGYFKVITDYAVPTAHTRGDKTYNVPEIWVSADFWGLKGKAPDGGKGWLNLQNGDLTITSRVPVPNAVACVIVVKEDIKLDPCVFMINPITWSKATLGDADGDYGYVNPIAQYALKGYSKAEQFNSHALSISGHYAACKAHGSVSPVYDFIGSKGNVENWESDTKDFKDKHTKRLQTISNTIPVADFVESMSKIHKHYKQGVGISHKFEKYALLATVAHYHKGDNITDEMWIEVANKIFVYEQNGLGGWSVENEQRINAEVEEAKDFAKAKGMSFSFTKTSNTKGRLAKANNSRNAKHYIRWVCASAVKCERFIKYDYSLPSDDLHVLTFALHSVSRKKSKYTDPKAIAKLAKHVKINTTNPGLFDVQIQAALSVRS